MRNGKTSDDLVNVLAEMDKAGRRQDGTMKQLTKMEQRLEQLCQGLHEASSRLCKDEQNVDVLQQKNAEIFRTIERNSDKINELFKSHRKGASCLTTLVHEMDKVKE